MSMEFVRLGKTHPGHAPLMNVDPYASNSMLGACQKCKNNSTCCDNETCCGNGGSCCSGMCCNPTW